MEFISTSSSPWKMYQKAHTPLSHQTYLSIFGGYVGRKERMLVVEDGIFDGIYIRRKLVLFRWNIEKFHAQEICKRCMLARALPAYKSSNHGRRRLPSSPTSSISYPTTPTIPPAWFIEEDTQGNNNMQQLTTRLGYEPQLGHARLVVELATTVHEDKAYICVILLSHHLLIFTINILYR